MIQMIYGSKGTGKTKKMIDGANAAAARAHGDVVFLTDTNRYTSEIKYPIRFINTETNGILNEDSLIGFIKGLISGNYDIKDIYIDGVMRMLRIPVGELGSFVGRLETLAKESEVKFVLSISAAEEAIPTFLKKYI